MKPKAKLDIISEEDNVNLMVWYYPWAGYVGPEMERYTGERALPNLCRFQRGYGEWAFSAEQWNRTGRKVYRDAKDGTLDVDRLREQSETTAGQVHAQSKRILNTDLSRAHDKDLLRLFTEWEIPVLRLNLLGMVPVIADYLHFSLSNELESIVKTKIRQHDAPGKAGQYVSLLATPTRRLLARPQSISLANLALKMENIGINPRTDPAGALRDIKANHPDLSRQLERHEREYSWLDYGYQGPAKHAVDFLRDAIDLIKNCTDLAGEVERLERAELDLLARQQQAARELKLTKGDLRLFAIAQDFMYLKGVRVEARHHAYCALDSILTEVGRRKGLTLKEARYMLPVELKDALEGKPTPAKGELHKRARLCIVECRDYEVKIIGCDEAANRYWKDNITIFPGSQVRVLQGQPACVGRAKGPAKIVIRKEDLEKVKPGDVLIAITTNPEYVPAMKNAVAFVTDTGGVTCHAAIVSREMSKPCVVGTKIATKSLKDGDLVEVDGTHGMVRKLG